MSTFRGQHQYTTMLKEFEYILSEIRVETHPEWGAFIRLIDDLHQDYIEDVLNEIFDLEYAFFDNDEETGNCLLYFDKNATFDQVKNIVDEINLYHKKNNKDYVLPSGT